MLISFQMQAPCKSASQSTFLVTNVNCQQVERKCSSWLLVFHCRLVPPLNHHLAANTFASLGWEMLFGPDLKGYCNRRACRGQDMAPKAVFTNRFLP